MNLRNRFLSMLVFSLFLLIALPAKNIRVGLFNLGQFSIIDDNGNASGYCIDYLNRISQTTRWTYTYVNTGNWNDSIDMLTKGTVDMIAPAQKSARREAIFDYPIFTMGTEYAAIYTLSERSDLMYQDYQAIEKLTVGVPSDSTFTTDFIDSYCPKHGILCPKLVRYSDTTVLLKAVKNKEVDAIVTNIMFAEESLKLLDTFSPAPIYLVVRKGNTELLDELNTALTDIQIKDPTFEASLISTYFPLYSQTSMTYREHLLVSEMPAINIGYISDRPPVSYVENGECKGITRDILDLIATKTGLTFNYVPIQTQMDNTLKVFKEKNIHVLSSVEYNSINLNIDSMRLTRPYLQSNKVFVTNRDVKLNSSSQLRLGISTGSKTLPLNIAREYPAFEIKNFPTVEDCLDALKSGKVDTVLQNEYSVSQYLSNPRYSSFKSLPVQNLNDWFSLAVCIYGDGSTLEQQLTKDGMFVSIIDKAIASIGQQELTNIIIKNASSSAASLSLSNVIYKYRYPLLAILFAIICLIAFFIALVRLKQKNLDMVDRKNQELEEITRQAEKASVAKSRFLSQMSHEIRTPMNAVIGLSAIARSEVSDPDKMKEYLIKIDGASRLLLSIINDILDMSAIESSKMKIAHERFIIKQVISSMTTLYYQQCKQKGITFSAVFSGSENEFFIGDSLRINQILMNLLSNAVKFTPSKGTVSLAVHSVSRVKNKETFRITVSDNGCGMSDEMVSRLFKPFEQESATTAQKYGGSGLGMAITKQLVSLMGGVISVESKAGKGTTFNVDLPLEISIDQPTVTFDKSRKDRALIVDDEPDTLAYTASVMDRIGIPHVEAKSGEDALELLGDAEDKGQPFTLCFVDWKMPGMSGLEVTKEIRKMFSKETTVIIVSAFDLNEIEAEGKAAGVDYFMTKPIFQSNVYDLLQKITNGTIQDFSDEKPKYDFSGHHVLIAEDVALNMEVAIKLLKMVNVESTCAEDGVQAVKLFTTSKPGTYDMIFMDVHMPNMDGYEATREIRASNHPEAKTIPIYAMTANAFTQDISDALSSGMNGHIAKPIETNILYDVLDKVFNHKEQKS